MAMYNRQSISINDVGPLVVQPVQRASVAFETSTTVVTGGYDFRVPTVTADATAAWVAEGADIPISDAVLSEITVVPSKVAGLVIISRELAEDSSPAAAQVVGDSLARDIARKVDQAWFGNMVAPAEPGLASVSGVQTVVGAYTSLDPFAEAISKAEQVGATLTTFATDPATALTLSKLKEATGSNKPLLGSDATAAGQRRVLGVDVVTSPNITAGTIWAYDRDRVWTVLRDDTTVDVDKSRYFESDRVGVRATLRVGFAFPHPQSIIKLTAA